jgi:hypothetical protein
MHYALVLVAGLLAAGPVRAEDYPKTVLRNQDLSLTVYLPDPVKGFYRGTRFDWSGVVGNIEFHGHRIFAPWKDTHDPTNHDDILGPVEDFGALGYAEAKPGEPILKIGVGELIKGQESKFRFDPKADRKDSGAWDVTIGPSEVVFKQAIRIRSGYGYRYTKRIELGPERGGFRIHHELINSGTRPIDTDCYNHNFFNIDADDAGPHYAVTLPGSFTIKGSRDRFEEVMAIREGRILEFTKPLETGSVYATLDGLAGQTGTIILSHRPSGVRISVHGDAPLEKVNFWSTRRAVCPEPFIRIRLKPGESKTWSIRYVFESPEP